MSPTRKSLAAALVLPLVVAVSLIARPAAVAVPATASRFPPRPPVLPVTVGAGGFQIPGPDPRTAGMVTFQVSTADPAGYYWVIGKARGDHTYEEITELEERVHSNDPARSIPALRELYAAVDYAGGTGTFGGHAPVSVTIPLGPGEYTAKAITAAISPSPNSPTHLDTLTVRDRYHPAVPPHVDGVILMVEKNGVASYQMPARLKAKGTYLVVNGTSHPQEAVFGGVVPGTTDADVSAYFAAMRNGQVPPRTFVSRVGGLTATSPGRWVLLSVDFPPGPYSVQSFYRNPDTGVGRAYEGMHRVVEFY